MSVWWGLIVLTAAVTVAITNMAAASHTIWLSQVSVGAFAAILIVAAYHLNVSILQIRSDADAKADLYSLNAGLLASAFAWGGVTILAGYYLTDLIWHHAWQYGLGMCLASLISYGTRWHLSQRECFLRQTQWLHRLTLLSGLLVVGASVGLAFLFIAGKLKAVNADWLANHVFVAGGISVMALSTIAVWAQIRASSVWNRRVRTHLCGSPSSWHFGSRLKFLKSRRNGG